MFNYYKQPLYNYIISECLNLEVNIINCTKKCIDIINSQSSSQFINLYKTKINKTPKLNKNMGNIFPTISVDYLTQNLFLKLVIDKYLYLSNLLKIWNKLLGKISMLPSSFI